MTGLEIGLVAVTVLLILLVVRGVCLLQGAQDEIDNLEKDKEYLSDQVVGVQKQLDRTMKGHHDFLEKQIGTLYARMGEETPTAALNSIPDRTFELRSILRKAHTKLIFKLSKRMDTIESLKKGNEMLLNSNEHLTKQLQKMVNTTINPPLTYVGVDFSQVESRTVLSSHARPDNGAKALKEVEAFRTKIYAFKGKANIGRDIVSGTFQVKAINLDEAIAFLKGELSYELDLEFYVEGKELLLGSDIDVLSVDFNKAQLV